MNKKECSCKLYLFQMFPSSWYQARELRLTNLCRRRKRRPHELADEQVNQYHTGTWRDVPALGRTSLPACPPKPPASNTIIVGGPERHRKRRPCFVSFHRFIPRHPPDNTRFRSLRWLYSIPGTQGRRPWRPPLCSLAALAQFAPSSAPEEFVDLRTAIN